MKYNELAKAKLPEGRAGHILRPAPAPGGVAQPNEGALWQLFCSMRHCFSALGAFMHPFCVQNEITPQQMRVLLTLHYAGPLTASALARETGMAVANNSVMCKRMAQAGLVNRRRHPQDERQVLISLSPKGRGLVTRFKRATAPAAAMVARQLGAKEINRINAGLARLAALVAEMEETAHE